MTRKMRLFWAVNITDELKDRIDSFSRGLRVSGLDARWVARDSLHLTLAFLGDTEPSLIGPMTAQVEKRLAGCASLQIRFGGAGFFPASGRPRVFWLGVRGDVAGLMRLQREVAAGSTAAGLTPDARPFSPHLTLARIKSGAGVPELLSRVLETGRGEIEGTLKVASVELMQSKLTPGGSIYTVVASLDLQSRVMKS